MSEEWLTKSELAAKLKVSVRTVERLKLPVVARVGGQNRYVFSEVAQFLNGGGLRPSADVIKMAAHR
jgi:DNA-binding CsgD family transcriptional regulator